MSHLLPVSASVVADVALLFGVGLLLNLPFGWLRARARRFSFLWFLYIHLSIPFLFLLRLALGLSLLAIPFSLAGAVLGQVAGARLRARLGEGAKSRRAPCTTCPLLARTERP